VSVPGHGEDGRLGEAVEELYGLPPAEFVAARTARARAARQAGDKAAATAIGALRKPSLAAWALNLLARRRPDDLRAYLDLAEAMRGAQRRLQGARLRELSAQRNQIVTALTRQTARLAADAGTRLGDAPERQVVETLHAALSDPAVADALAHGRLATSATATGELPAAEAEPEAAEPEAAEPEAAEVRPAPTPARPRARARPRATDRDRPCATDRDRRKREEHVERAEREERAERKRAQREHREAVAAARRRLSDAEAAARTAEKASRSAERRFAEAREERDAARAHARHTARQADQARRALHRLTSGTPAPRD
jgi:hypothetical protein